MKLSDLNNNKIQEDKIQEDLITEGFMSFISSLGNAAANIASGLGNAAIKASQILGQVGMSLFGDDHEALTSQVGSSLAGSSQFNELPDGKKSEIMSGATIALASNALDPDMRNKLLGGKISKSLIKKIQQINDLKQNYTELYLEAGYDEEDAEAKAIVDIGLKKDIKQVKKELEAKSDV